MTAMDISSLPLLLIFVILGPLVLVSYGMSIKGSTAQEKEDLFAGISGAAKIPFGVLPPCCAAAFIYSTWFILGLPADASVLGLPWAEGGEALVCVMYAFVVGLSIGWMPATFRCLRSSDGSGVALVVLILNGVGLPACVLAACALTCDGTGVRGTAAFTWHCIAALLFAAQTEITDGVVWSYMFASMMKRRQQGEVRPDQYT